MSYENMAIREKLKERDISQAAPESENLRIRERDISRHQRLASKNECTTNIRYLSVGFSQNKNQFSDQNSASHYQTQISKNNHDENSNNCEILGSTGFGQFSVTEIQRNLKTDKTETSASGSFNQEVISDFQNTKNSNEMDKENNRNLQNLQKQRAHRIGRGRISIQLDLNQKDFDKQFMDQK